ncbi:MAG TPA: rhodanese-like domain-containing protein, partial [Candidatus Saccharimonadales bacterium]|nr:rhodanese-like domain-containing protein [Candidatus Saccharimonadales bacterium]
DGTLVATTEHVRDWSREATGRSGGPTRLLDVRTAAEWVGAEPGAARGGHIPGARLRHVNALLTSEGTVRSVDAALSLLRASGVDPAEVRAVYCQDGVRSALAWFVLHELAGLDDVALYAGGWEDWGNRSDSPVEVP